MSQWKSSPKLNLSRILSLTVALGVVLCLAASASAQAESTIFDFTYSSSAGVILDSAGNLYGATYSGGANNAGYVWKLSLVAGTWQQTTLYTFTGGADGKVPYSPLTFDAAGNLYGTTELGGASGVGVVFKLTPTLSGEWQQSVLYSFTGQKDGGYPAVGNLVFDRQGNLYGSNLTGGNTTTQNCSNTSGCGVLFQLSPQASGTWTFKILRTFLGGWDGVGPAHLAFDTNGVLYGAAAGAWQGFELPASPGLIFTLAPNASGPWKETPIYSFNDGPDGGLPNSIFFANDGSIYGTGADGGIGPDCLSGYQTNMGCGVVFRLSRNSSGQWRESVLYAFTGGADGSAPSSLVFDHGKLYGTTYSGGLVNGQNSRYGVVFELNRGASGWTESVVHNFHGSDGSNPESLVVDAAGHVFGTTSGGGSNLGGVAFEIAP